MSSDLNKSIKSNRSGRQAARQLAKANAPTEPIVLQKQGPTWEADEDTNGGGESLGTFTIYESYPDGSAYPVATAPNWRDARLIAAAPEMLEALRHAEGVLADANGRGDLGPHETGTLAAVRAAIARATGGAL